MLLTIVSFLLLLGILMFFHELGHYWIARRNNIEVEEFGVFGFPPRIVKLFTYKGTDFTLNAIPLGAFVRMKGEDMGDRAPGSFNAASAGARAAVLVAGPVMNFLLAFLFSIFSVMSGFPAAVANPQVTSVTGAGVAAQAGLQAGDVILSADGEPVYVGHDGALVDTNRADFEVSTADGLTIVRDGAITTLPLPSGVSRQDVLDSSVVEPVLLTRVTVVADNSPAQEAGMQAGDIVYAVNGDVVTPSNSLGSMVSQYPDSEVTLTILRGTQWLERRCLCPRQPARRRRIDGRGDRCSPSAGVGLCGRGNCAQRHWDRRLRGHGGGATGHAHLRPDVGQRRRRSLAR
ncbi:MAG: site-2 protease family protein [Caldilineaceae bacterium]